MFPTRLAAFEHVSLSLSRAHHFSYMYITRLITDRSGFGASGELPMLFAGQSRDYRTLRGI